MDPSMQRSLRFETINLPRDADVAVALRRDSYVCSFGSDEAFGPVDDYLNWLRQRIEHHPAGHVHLWNGTQVIGQVEMLIRKTSPREGYVSLFYLTPEARGKGHGHALHQYFTEFMLTHGAQLARLSVSPSNARALAYYHKHGWQDAGPNPVDPTVRLMELGLVQE